jgi:hypothetical protein
MRDDFACFILTHGRPDNVKTYASLRKAGYTGRIYIVIDDEDKAGDQYRANYGDQVVTFSKAAIAPTFDEMNNFNDRRSVIYARNFCHDLAERLGLTYFLELDDDYSGFYLRFDSAGNYCVAGVRRTFDSICDLFLSFLDTSGALCVAFSQGGDHIGGSADNTARRKAMNSFFCRADRRFLFRGILNDDVNTYVSHGATGGIMLTVMAAQLNQQATQAQSGGLTDIYLDSGTYAKSFYTVMVQPSSVSIGELGDPRSPSYRIHHKIDWPKTVPMILSPEHRKPRPL